ncbi:MAG: hypothetical protein LAQ30_07890 [Acidobacteriia bacterium]|nr:hypothetical protein [Terriglobia bacterium]
MQIAADEIRRYYASLSDDMLREVDPTDLTAVARQCYQVEFAARGLNRRSAASEPAAEEQETAGEPLWEELPELPEDNPDWLEHAACACSYVAYPGTDHASDAARAQDALLAAGIPCHLSVVSPDPENEASQRYDEYRVLVPHSLNLKALSVLDREIFNPEMEAEWRSHFAGLSDEELAALKPEFLCAGLLDRVERLTRAYRDEMARRRTE